MAVDLYELAAEVVEQIVNAGCPMRDKGDGEWRGRCPLGEHDDLELRVDEERERLWLDCRHVSCDWRNVHQALGLTAADLRLGRRQAKWRDPELRNPDLGEVRALRWASRDRIPIGKQSLIVGNEGVGKGTVTAYLAAGWSRGTIEGDLCGEPANVLIVGDEDGLAKDWTARLHVVDADFEHIFFQKIGDSDIDFTEPGDIEHMRGWIRRYGITVVVFDALLDHIGGSDVDEFKPKAVRGALRPLRRLAAEEEVAMVGTMHPRKGRVASFRDLVANSHQFNAVSRSSLLLAPHPDDPTMRVLAWGKGNHAGLVPTLEFRVEPDTFIANGELIKTVKAVDWAESDVTLEDAIGASGGGTGRGPGRPPDESKWKAIAQALTDEPQSATAIAAASGASRALAYDVLGDYAVDGIAAKDGRCWVRGPQWSTFYEERQQAPEQASSNSREGISGRSNGLGLHTRARARKDEPAPSRNSSHGIAGRFSGRVPGREQAPEQAPLWADDEPPDAGAQTNGSADPDAVRRARAADAIRRAQEQAG